MITTIQLNKCVKKELDKLKSAKETYEEVIIGLIKFAAQYKKNQEQLLIEGCKEMAEESLKIAKEFEAIENLKDWEW